MIRIRRSTLKKMGLAVAVTLILVALGLTAAFLLQRKDYLRDIEVLLHPDAFIGQQIRVRGYLSVTGTIQTVTACNPPRETFTSYGLSRIHLMDCEVEQCTMTCPLFTPIRGSYEIVGTLSYCPGERLCLIDIKEVYRLKNVSEDSYGGQKLPVTPGPASFTVRQQWQQP